MLVGFKELTFEVSEAIKVILQYNSIYSNAVELFGQSRFTGNQSLISFVETVKVQII